MKQTIAKHASRLRDLTGAGIGVRDPPVDEFPWAAQNVPDLEAQDSGERYTAFHRRRRQKRWSLDSDDDADFELPLDCRPLEDIMFHKAKPEVLYTIAGTKDPDQPRTGILNLCTLQHIELRRIQIDIAEVVAKWNKDRYAPDGRIRAYDTENKDPVKTMRVLLQDYCQAVRDLDFMKECALRGYQEDPFILKTSRAVDRRILESAHLLPYGRLLPADDAKHPQLRTQGRHKAHRMAHAREQSTRLLFAIAGGLSLILPMLIMANVPGKIASLVTTCISMLIFVILIAFLTRLSPNEVLATTAAYAAVLVVFVGTSLRP